VRSRLLRGRPLGWLAGISALALMAAPAAAQAAKQTPARGHGPGRGQLALVTVSNPRPELVSGGEVLVRVDVPQHVDAGDVRITADGHDVTAAFQTQSDGSLLGLESTSSKPERGRLFPELRGSSNRSPQAGSA